MTAVPSRIQQMYGYAVCLIAIIVGLVSLSGVVNGSFDLARPAQMTGFGLAAVGMGGPYIATRAVTTPQPDSVLRRYYSENRLNQARFAHWQAVKSMVTSAVMLLVSIILFALHWKWLARSGDVTISREPI